MTAEQLNLLDFMYGKTLTFNDIRLFFDLSEEDFERQRNHLLDSEVYRCLRQLPCESRNTALLQRPVCLSNRGIALVEKSRETRQSNKMKEIRGWITTVIAVLALLLSVLSLTWQIYTWRLEEKPISESMEPKSTAIATMAEHHAFLPISLVGH